MHASVTIKFNVKLFSSLYVCLKLSRKKMVSKIYCLSDFKKQSLLYVCLTRINSDFFEIQSVYANSMVYVYM